MSSDLPVQQGNEDYALLSHPAGNVKIPSKTYHLLYRKRTHTDRNDRGPFPSHIYTSQFF